MKVLRHNQTDFDAALTAAIAASSLFDPGIEERVRHIIADVQARGDTALRELTERFDKVRLNQFAVTGPTPSVSADLK